VIAATTIDAKITARSTVARLNEARSRSKLPSGSGWLSSGADSRPSPERPAAAAAFLRSSTVAVPRSSRRGRELLARIDAPAVPADSMLLGTGSPAAESTPAFAGTPGGEDAASGGSWSAPPEGATGVSGIAPSGSGGAAGGGATPPGVESDVPGAGVPGAVVSGVVVSGVVVSGVVVSGVFAFGVVVFGGVVSGVVVFGGVVSGVVVSGGVVSGVIVVAVVVAVVVVPGPVVVVVVVVTDGGRAVGGRETGGVAGGGLGGPGLASAGIASPDMAPATRTTDHASTARRTSRCIHSPPGSSRSTARAPTWSRECTPGDAPTAMPTDFGL
jgi:hypothetical protein